MFKRCLALILCFVLLSCTFVYAEDSQEQIKPEWLTQAEILSSMKLLDNYTPDNFGFNSPVSRAEFVDTIANFYFEHSSNTSTGYSDVPKEHWAASAIALAAQLNLISPAANFFPDNEILLSEAIKIAVSVLGYGQIAEQDGGYPKGYLNYAAKLGLRNNLDGSSFCRGDMITLIYNMLDATVMEEVNFGLSGPQFKAGDKFFDALGYKEITGVVVADNVVAINGASIKNKNKIQIEDVTVVCENSAGLVGRRVECYYKYDSTIRENVAVYITFADEGILRIGVSDIINLTSTNIKYADDNDIENLSLSKNLEIVYNGRREVTLPQNMFIPENGWIELTDYDKNGTYDVLFIYSFEEYIVSVYNATEGMIYDKIDRSRYINVDDDFDRLDVYVNGEPASLDKITPNSLISVAKSRDGKVMQIYASTNVISAQAKEFGDDYITLDGVDYKYTRAFYTNNFYDISVKDMNNYYINSFGYISYATSANTKMYGYLLGVAGESALDPEIKVKMLDNEGNVKVYETAERIKLNGTGMNSTELTTSSLLFAPNASGDPEFECQLCTYTLDDTGAVKTINVAGANAIGQNELVLNYDGTEDGIVLRSYKTSQIMLNKYVLTEATKVFLIADEDRNMMATTPASLSPDGSYKAVLYDWEDAVVGAMVIDNRDGSSGSVFINTESAPVVVADVLRSIDEETGVETTKIFAYQNGALVDMYPEDEDTCGNASASLPGFANIPFKNLKPGDVIQNSTNFAGRITSFRLLFGMNRGMDGKTEVTYSESSASDVSGTITGKYAKMYNVYGSITDIYSNTLFKVNVATGTGQDLNGYTVADFDRILQTGGGKIYMYDKDRDEVSVISASEILIGDMVYARTRYTLTEELYVVR